MWSIYVYAYDLHFAFVFVESKMVHFEFQAIFYEWYKVFWIKKILFWKHLFWTYRSMRGIV